MKCIGFGELKGKCQKKAGTEWSDRWCDECDEKRRDHISDQMDSIAEKFGHIPVVSKTVEVSDTTRAKAER